jgi:succinyl-CoA synthetase alpha subunit
MSILLSKETTFIVQGITGREAVNLTKECLDYGSKIVGGVTPGRKGREVHGVPVFDTVAQAVEHHGGPIDGSVGVMSRSGGMTTEISSTLTAAGLGVSTAVSIGGDAIIGSTYAELMPFFEADEQTKAIVIYTEPGGRMEAQLAEWVKENNSRLPIVAFMAGKFMDDEEMKGMSFGHAGTIVEGAEDTATQKIARLEAAGIRVVERIDEIPTVVKEKLGVTA